MPFRKWPDIESLHHVVRGYDKYLSLINAGEIEKWEPGTWTPPTITYRGKIKLHGTNAGVRVDPDGTVYAQSRTNDVGVVDKDSGNPDNAGWAAWVKEHADWFRERAYSTGTTIFFGEWCGAGIQKGCAIHQIGRKVFAIFAIHYDEGAEDTWSLMVDPDQIRHQFLGTDPLPDDIYLLPWYGDEIVIDFNDRVDIKASIEVINEIIREVEKEDPWVKKVFGADGIGEGVVYYPITENVCEGFEDREVITRPMFKAKGEKHKTNQTKKRQAVQIDPDVLASIEEFVEAFVTEARCEQGVVDVCGGVCEPKLTGKFLGWMGKDIQKESVAELEASGLTWKQVSKAVNTASREWYLLKAKAI